METNLETNEAVKPKIVIKQLSMPVIATGNHDHVANKIAAIENEGYENYFILNSGMGEVTLFFRLKKGLLND